ncbi:MAG: DeoR/GlpR transcriptional regulator [Selenomonadaceae bacterium]|nr:DeoR/GlpR transcriptional regulator [Selenomonadaceae bacterium]
MKNSRSEVFKRQQALLEELRRQEIIDVNAVAAKLDVSPTTIRRDLIMFDREHLIERFHGGAKLKADTLREEDTAAHSAEAGEDETAKQVIARYAADLVEDGDTIFMNSSSTTLMMLNYLGDKRVIVITNNGSALDCVDNPNVEVILTGGKVYRHRRSLVGEFAALTLTKIFADKAFLGVGGISVDAGITTSVLPETAVNETMIRCCQGKCYVLAAPPKIGRKHNFRSTGIDKITAIITCEGADAKEVASLRERGVAVVELKA